MNYEVAMAMQKVCTGEKVELTKGQIAEQAIDLKTMLRNFSDEKAERCTAYYNEMIADDEKSIYDIDTLTETIEEQKNKFMNFIYNEDSGDQFAKMMDKIENLLLNSPFEDLDSMPYGVAEVCIFSVLEYFVCKKLGLDHEIHRSQYRLNLVNSTDGEPVAAHWIGVYDALQKRYEAFGTEFDSDGDFKKAIIASSLVALAAIKDQDDYMLDIVQGGAAAKAEEIFEELESEEYQDGLSTSVDNAVVLFKFVYGYFIA